MFRREVNGNEQRFSVLGLWGSGNVITEREKLYGDEEYTAWSMWDGHALFGPERPSVVEKFPAFLGIITVEDFVDRYASLGDRCEIWSGDEVTGLGCDEACTHIIDVCGTADEQACLDECADLPRPIVDCFLEADDCDEEAACGQAFRERL